MFLPCVLYSIHTNLVFCATCVLRRVVRRVMLCGWESYLEEILSGVWDSGRRSCNGFLLYLKKYAGTPEILVISPTGWDSLLTLCLVTPKKSFVSYVTSFSSSKSDKVTAKFYSALVWPHLECLGQFFPHITEKT